VLLHQEDSVAYVGWTIEQERVILIAAVNHVASQDHEPPNALPSLSIRDRHADARAAIGTGVVRRQIGALYDVTDIGQILA
jgi:hypothetical protein